jgi:hypothetical protein
MADIPLEGVGDVGTQEGSLYSTVEGGGAETANLIVISLMTYLFQSLNGNGMVVGFPRQFLVDAGLVEVAIAQVLQVNHSKYWMDRVFGLVVTKKKSMVSIGVDSLLDIIEMLTT